MSRDQYQNRNRMGFNSNEMRDGSYRNNMDRPSEGDRMQYARNEGYGRHLDSDSNYRGGMNEFERGRKASRDYDSNYTGYRSSNDAGDIGHDREMWNSRVNGNDSFRHGADYGSVASARYNSSGYGASEFGNTSAYGPSYGSSYGPSSSWGASNPGYSGGTQGFYDGRMQGYRSDEANNQVSHAGKGPKGWKRTDERIKEDVSQMLERDHVVDASEIEVSVNDGVVTLSGHVETRPTKRRAEDIIENISGVRDVRNELAVDQSLFQQAKDFILGSESSDKKTSTTKTVTSRH